MKNLDIFIAACAAALPAATGIALAQNGTGNGNMGTGPDGEASGVYPAPTQGVEQAPSITDAPPATTSSKPHHGKRKHDARKKMNDTTTGPASETRGQ